METQTPAFVHIADVTRIYLLYSDTKCRFAVIYDVAVFHESYEPKDLLFEFIEPVNHGELYVFCKKRGKYKWVCKILHRLPLSDEYILWLHPYDGENILVMYGWKIYELILNPYLSPALEVSLANIPMSPYHPITFVLKYADSRTLDFHERVYDRKLQVHFCRNSEIWYYGKYIHQCYEKNTETFCGTLNSYPTRKQIEAIDNVIRDFVIELTIGKQNQAFINLRTNHLFEPHTLRIVFDFL